MRGNLVARSVVNRHGGHLVVLGDLVASALVGVGEREEILVAGNAEIGRALFIDNHHVGVKGRFKCTDWAHDATHSSERVSSLLAGLGHLHQEYPFHLDLAAVGEALASLPMPAFEPVRERIEVAPRPPQSETTTPSQSETVTPPQSETATDSSIVNHKVFGEGTIVARLEGEKLDIDFGRAGRKVIHKRFVTP